MNEVMKKQLEEFLKMHGWEIAVDFYDEDGKLKGLAICEPEYLDTIRDMVPSDMVPLADDDTILH